MRNDFESNYLAHHGIQGQKWGVRNGPPYPLGSGDHSASEKKAGWKKSLGGGRNEEHYATTKKKKSRLERAADAAQRDADNLRKYGYKEEADAVQKVADRNREKAAKKENNNGIELTDAQKKAIKIGLGVAGATAITAGAVYVAKKGNTKILEGLAKESIKRGEAYTNAFLKWKRNSDNAYEIAKVAKKQGYNSISELLNSYGDRFYGLSEASRHNALSEGIYRQNLKGYTTSKDKVDYLKRIITEKPKSMAELEKELAGYRANGLNFSADAWESLIKNYAEYFNVKI